jgi:hypothetical protein
MIIGTLDRLDLEDCAGWVMDTEHPEKKLEITLIVNGKVKARELAGFMRVDVGLAHGHAEHGFSFGVAEFLEDGKNVVEIVVEGSEYRFNGSPKTLDTRDYANFVEIGVDGWLFLQNDSNEVKDIIEGRKALTDDEIIALRAMLLRRQALIKGLGALGITYILPEKGVVCNNFRQLPLSISAMRPAVQISKSLINLHSSGFAYPKNSISQDFSRGQFFCKKDTHPSPSGYEYIFYDIMKRLNIEPTLQWGAQHEIEFFGDLGTKLNPVQSEHVLTRDPVYETIHLEDEVEEPLKASGRLREKRVYHESNAPNQLCCVLIGTSAAYNARKLFFAQFRHVHFYWENAIDDDYLREVRPDVVIALTAERFFSHRILDNSIKIKMLASNVRSGSREI